MSVRQKRDILLKPSSVGQTDTYKNRFLVKEYKWNWNEAKLRREKLISSVTLSTNLAIYKIQASAYFLTAGTLFPPWDKQICLSLFFACPISLIDLVIYTAESAAD